MVICVAAFEREASVMKSENGLLNLGFITCELSLIPRWLERLEVYFYTLIPTAFTSPYREVEIMTQLLLTRCTP